MKKKALFSIPDKKRLLAITLYGLLALVIFTLIYGFCNHQASLSSHHYKMYTQWELSLPLIPWMIYPYISLNLLFIISAFIVHEVKAIKYYCLSLVYSAFIAGLIFYFFPGELGFVRKAVPGYEDIFNFMFSIDHPHNLFPSLHVTYSSIAIWTIIDQTYNKNFHKIMYLWQFLIATSVVFVHQHHLFDIATGFILAFIIYKFSKNIHYYNHH